MDYKQILNYVFSPIAPVYFELPVVETARPYIVVEGSAEFKSIWQGDFILNLHHDSNDLDTPNELLKMGKVTYVDGVFWAHGSINKVNESISDELNVSLTKYNMILRGR